MCSQCDHFFSLSLENLKKNDHVVTSRVHLRIIRSVHSVPLSLRPLLLPNCPPALLSYRYGASQLLKGSWLSPEGQRRCALFPASSSSSASSSSPPSSSYPSSSSCSYSPGCRERQLSSSPSRPNSSRGHRLSKVSFAKGSS